MRGLVRGLVLVLARVRARARVLARERVRVRVRVLVRILARGPVLVQGPVHLWMLVQVQVLGLVQGPARVRM